MIWRLASGMPGLQPTSESCFKTLRHWPVTSMTCDAAICSDKRLYYGESWSVDWVVLYRFMCPQSGYLLGNSS